MSNSIGLYQQLCTIDHLLLAWQTIKQKGKAGGIDNVSVQHFQASLKKNIYQLHTQLIAGTYTPEPYKQILIPKNETEFRTLGLPAVKDKVVQQAVKLLIEPILEDLFLNVNYAYRKNKGTTKAIKRVQHLIRHEKRYWVAKCDIRKFFDNLSHPILVQQLHQHIANPQLVNLIMLWVKIGRVSADFSYTDLTKGVPQGGIISPLLANLYLHPFDAFVVNQQYGYVRYADDFAVFVRTKNEAKQAMGKINTYLTQTLQLAIKEEKKAIVNINQGFSFLGIYFKGMQIGINQAKKEQLKQAINDNTFFTKKGILSAKCPETLNGIAAYYGRLLPQSYLEEMDAWLIKALSRAAAKAFKHRYITAKKHLLAALERVQFFSLQYQTATKYHFINITNEAAQHKYILSAPPIPHTANTSAKAVANNNYKSNTQTKTKQLIEKKKKQYAKLEQRGRELYISSPGLYIGKQHKSIVIKQKGKILKKMGVAALKHITIASRGVSVSYSAVQHCVINDISIQYLSKHGRPFAMLHEPNNFSAELGLLQLEAFNNFKAEKIARAITSAKLKNQSNLLKYYAKARDRHTDLVAQLHQLSDAIDVQEEKVGQLNTSKCKNYEGFRSQLFITEAQGAKSYWKGVALLLEGYAAFSGRERKGAKGLVNSLLNYGYGMLYSRVWEKVIKVGLNPHISYIHSFQNNKPTLVFDLVEPFRQQAVDRQVISLLAKGYTMEVADGLLTNTSKKHLVNAIVQRLNKSFLYKGQKNYLNQIMLQQAYELCRYLKNECVRYTPFVAKW